MKISIMGSSATYASSKHGYDYQESPYSKRDVMEIGENAGDHYTIDGHVAILFDDVVYYDEDWFINEISKRSVGSDALTNIAYDLVDVTADERSVVVWYQGDIDMSDFDMLP